MIVLDVLAAVVGSAFWIGTSSGGAQLNPTGINILPLGVTEIPSTQNAENEVQVPLTATYSNMLCSFPEWPERPGQGWTVTLQETGQNTPLSCTVDGGFGHHECNDMSHSARIPYLHYATLRIQGYGNPRPSRVHCTLRGDVQ